MARPRGTRRWRPTAIGCGAAGVFVVPGSVSGWASARVNSAAVVNRSAGATARARLIACSTASGTPWRRVRTCGSGSSIRLAITACGVRPLYGTSPVSISYKTQPML